MDIARGSVSACIPVPQFGFGLVCAPTAPNPLGCAPACMGTSSWCPLRTAAPRETARSISSTRTGFTLTVTTVPAPRLSSTEMAPPAPRHIAAPWGVPRRFLGCIAFKSIRTRHAEFKRALLVVDAGALIRKANRVAVVQYGNDRLAELRVYEVSTSSRMIMSER